MSHRPVGPIVWLPKRDRVLSALYGLTALSLAGVAVVLAWAVLTVLTA